MACWLIICTYIYTYKHNWSITGMWMECKLDIHGILAITSSLGILSFNQIPWIWVNNNNSLTWIVGPFGDDFPNPIPMIPGFGRSIEAFSDKHGEFGAVGLPAIRIGTDRNGRKEVFHHQRFSWNSKPEMQIWVNYITCCIHIFFSIRVCTLLALPRMLRATSHLAVFLFSMMGMHDMGRIMINLPSGYLT